MHVLKRPQQDNHRCLRLATLCNLQPESEGNDLTQEMNAYETGKIEDAFRKPSADPSGTEPYPRDCPRIQVAAKSPQGLGHVPLALSEFQYAFRGPRSASGMKASSLSYVLNFITS